MELIALKLLQEGCYFENTPLNVYPGESMAQDAGNSFAQATRLRLKISKVKLEDSLSELDKFDFYRFSLSQSETFLCALEGVEGNVELTLFDKNRQRIARSNEQDGKAESIQQQLDKGSYFVQVKYIAGAVDYSLEATTIELQGISFGNAIEVEKNGSDTVLTGNITYKGKVSNSSRQEKFEYYEFTLVDRASFQGTLDQLGADCEFELFDANRQQIALSDRRNVRSEQISQVLEAGVYYLRIKVKREETDYRLKLKYQEVQFGGGTIATAETLTTIATSQTITSVIGGSDKSDYYKIDLLSDGYLNLSLKDLQSDANIQIVDVNGTVIANSTAAGITQKLLDTNLTAGSYYIYISTASTTVNTYSINYYIDYGSNSIGNANIINVLPTPTTTTDGLSITDAEDYYKVDFTVPGRLNLALNGLTADANLELLDSNGTVIDRSTNAGTASELITNNLNPGTYYVRVALANGATGSTGYQLSYERYNLPLFALNDKNRLTALDPNAIDQPGKLYAYLDVTGLASGETLEEIDFRPGINGSQLYGLSSANKLYTIDQKTGAATQVGTTAFGSTTGISYGFDFNPAVDRLRITTEADENFRVDPVTGLVAGVDTSLTYAAGDINAGANPNVTAVAYTNDVASATTTTLYGIDTDLDVLVRQGGIDGIPSPNTGALATIGSLGFDFAELSGFDIFTTGSGINLGYATSGNSVYTINLTTGAATALKDVQDSGTGALYTLVGAAVRPV